MEILHRQPARRQRMNLTLAEFNEKVYTANTRMKDLCSTTPNVEFWQHPEQLRRPGVICADGVHLNDRDMRKYWRSVRGAALRAAKMESLSASSPTAKLSMLFLHCVQTLKLFIPAAQTGYFKLHLHSVSEMLNLFAATGHTNHAKSGRLYI